MRLILRLDASDANALEDLRHLLARDEGTPAAIVNSVRDILADVRARGDAALADYTIRFDRLPPDDDGSYRIPVSRIAQARVSPELEQALQLAANRIEDYHQRMMPTNMRYQDEMGIDLGWRWTSLDAVGLYVPGGTASYPSSVLMNAIVAKVAGVKRLVMTVPAPDGVLNDAVLVAARIAGIDEIYSIGGAQACAALAYGTDHIMKVDKIVGPGNAFVAEAKRQLFGVVGIDTIAGPSEILVIADETANPEWVACDMLSQAEHDKMASAMLITTSAAMADAVEAELLKQLEHLPRHEMARHALANHSAIILAEDKEAACFLANEIASEHLELAVANPDHWLPYIRHAGAIFMGHYTPEAAGDYLAGPSHVLPTSGAARFGSGLSVYDFIKRQSLIGYSEAALQAHAPIIEALAAAEGLDAHRLSAFMRRKKNGSAHGG